ncbi:MAG: hypothetical protein WC091_19890 [Sulfuricellaceae bacterium]
MKTHEIAEQLEAFAKLLRSLPDTEIETVLSTLIGASTGTRNEPTKNLPRSGTPLPEGVESRLATMTPAEIERYLDSDVDSESFTTARLMELTERLGISASKRQGRSALVNLITRHFEANQMDSIIRTARKDESQHCATGDAA